MNGADDLWPNKDNWQPFQPDNTGATPTADRKGQKRLTPCDIVILHRDDDNTDDGANVAP